MKSKVLMEYLIARTPSNFEHEIANPEFQDFRNPCSYLLCSSLGHVISFKTHDCFTTAKGKLTKMTSKLSRGYYELVRSIGESKSKQEEDRIISKEIIFLREALPTASGSHASQFDVSAISNIKTFAELSQNIGKITNLTPLKRELVLRLIYVEMLGHDGSFGYVQAVQLCASDSLLDKKVGYLCAGMTLKPTHDLRFMLVNQMQRDLKSPNFLISSTALSAVSRLISVDMIPAVYSDLLILLEHSSTLLRKRALNTVSKIYRLSGSRELDDPLRSKLKKLLEDSEPSVYVGCLNFLAYLLTKHPLYDLKQDEGARLSEELDLKRHLLGKVKRYTVGASGSSRTNWIQVRTIKLVSLFKGTLDDQIVILSDFLRSVCSTCSISHTSASYTLLYETILCISKIYEPRDNMSALLGEVSRALNLFLSSANNNLKYLGLGLLVKVVAFGDRFAAEHEGIVMDCLDTDEEGIESKTVDLLINMIKKNNAEFILQRLLSHYQKKEVSVQTVEKLMKVAESMLESDTDYVKIMFKLMTKVSMNDNVIQERLDILLNRVSHKQISSEAIGIVYEQGMNYLSRVCDGNFSEIVAVTKAVILLVGYSCPLEEITKAEDVLKKVRINLGEMDDLLEVFLFSMYTMYKGDKISKEEIIILSENLDRKAQDSVISRSIRFMLDRSDSTTESKVHNFTMDSLLLPETLPGEKDSPGLSLCLDDFDLSSTNLTDFEDSESDTDYAIRRQNSKELRLDPYDEADSSVQREPERIESTSQPRKVFASSSITPNVWSSTGYHEGGKVEKAEYKEFVKQKQSSNDSDNLLNFEPSEQKPVETKRSWNLSASDLATNWKAMEHSKSLEFAMIDTKEFINFLEVFSLNLSAKIVQSVEKSSEAIVAGELKISGTSTGRDEIDDLLNLNSSFSGDEWGKYLIHIKLRAETTSVQIKSSEIVVLEKITSMVNFALKR
eukprot:snap_masked-scaffold_6-processed-gene-7.23-mRNA-1 protein AED:1.00 eAED:1.00 QI:0/0/0/0/1/1/2/0/954